jgi:hypothetical protein
MNKNDRLERLTKEIKGNANKGVALTIFGAVILALLLTLSLGKALKNNAPAAAPKAASCCHAVATNDDCEIVIRYNEKGTPPEHRKADGSPLVITRRMQDALISVPLGTSIDFTKSGIPCKKIVLHNYDNTAFNYAWLPDGFRLTVKKNIPEGRARTTDISVDDEKFWLEFAFSKACEN